MRTKPYTDTGLRRLRCSIYRCANPATEQWRVRSCRAGGPEGWRAVCDDHDAELNQFVIDFFDLENKAARAEEGLDVTALRQRRLVHNAAQASDSDGSGAEQGGFR